MFKDKVFKKKKAYNKKGFTLVETIIYIALIATVVSTFVSFGIKVTQIRNKSYVIEEVRTNAGIVMDFLSEKIKMSSAVLSPSVQERQNSIELDFKNENLLISVLDGSLIFSLGTSSPQIVNSKKTQITNLEFINIGSSNESSLIKIKFTIEFKDGESLDFRYSEDLETTVSLRL